MEEEGCNFIEKSYLKNKLHWNLGKVPQVEHTHTPTHTRARARAPTPETSTHCCLPGRRQDQVLALTDLWPPEGHAHIFIPISLYFLDARSVPLTAPSTL